MTVLTELSPIGYNLGMNYDREKSLPSVLPQWHGNLEDDCTAKCGGLMLRAEWMQADRWWWAVYDPQIQSQVATSDGDARPCCSGEDARRRAENAATVYLQSGLPSR